MVEAALVYLGRAGCGFGEREEGTPRAERFDPGAWWPRADDFAYYTLQNDSSSNFGRSVLGCITPI